MELLCIETHRTILGNLVLSGLHYSLVDKSECGCGQVSFNVGVTTSSIHSWECTCGKVFSRGTSAYHKAEFFAQIGTRDEHETYEIKEPQIVEK